MQFLKFDNVLANDALVALAAGNTCGVDQYNAFVAALGAVRDRLRRPGEPAPTIPYSGPLADLRAAGTRVPVVGYTSPRDLDDTVPAGSSATEQSLYLRAQYASAITGILQNLPGQVRVTTVTTPASGALDDYSGQVAVLEGDVEDALLDPTRASSTTRVTVPAATAQQAQTLLQGLDAVGEQQRAAAEGRSVSATATARAQTGLATAERAAQTVAAERRTANLRAAAIFGVALGAAYLWGR